MPLPTGIWNANINGIESPLQVNAPNQSGVLTVVFSGVEFDGYWDEVSQTITFSVTLAFDRPGKPVVGVFKGCLFRTPPNPGPGQDVVATLAGSVQVTTGSHQNPGLAATSRRNVFGWFAQVTDVN
jgi:hypothetical protein